MSKYAQEQKVLFSNYSPFPVASQEAVSLPDAYDDKAVRSEALTVARQLVKKGKTGDVKQTPTAPGSQAIPVAAASAAPKKVSMQEFFRDKAAVATGGLYYSSKYQHSIGSQFKNLSQLFDSESDTRSAIRLGLTAILTGRYFLESRRLSALTDFVMQQLATMKDLAEDEETAAQRKAAVLAQLQSLGADKAKLQNYVEGYILAHAALNHSIGHLKSTNTTLGSAAEIAQKIQYVTEACLPGLLTACTAADAKVEVKEGGAGAAPAIALPAALSAALQKLARMSVVVAGRKVKCGDAAYLVVTPHGVSGSALDGAFLGDEDTPAIAELATRLIPGASALLALGSQHLDEKAVSTMVTRYLLETISKMSSSKFPANNEFKGNRYNISFPIPFRDPKTGQRKLFTCCFGDLMMLGVTRTQQAEGQWAWEFKTLQSAYKIKDEKEGRIKPGHVLPFEGAVAGGALSEADKQNIADALATTQAGVTDLSSLSSEQEFFVITLSDGVWPALATEHEEVKGLREGAIKQEAFYLDPAVWSSAPKVDIEAGAGDAKEGKQEVAPVKLGPDFLQAFINGDDTAVSRKMGDWFLQAKARVQAAEAKEAGIQRELVGDAETFQGYKFRVNDFFAMYTKATTEDKLENKARVAFIVPKLKRIKELPDYEARIAVKLQQAYGTQTVQQALTTVYGEEQKYIAVTTDPRYQAFIVKAETLLAQYEAKSINDDQFVADYIRIVHESYPDQLEGGKLTADPHQAQKNCILECETRYKNKRLAKSEDTEQCGDDFMLAMYKWLSPAELVQAQEFGKKVGAFTPFDAKPLAEKVGGQGLFAKTPALQIMTEALKDLFAIPEGRLKSLVSPPVDARSGSDAADEKKNSHYQLHLGNYTRFGSTLESCQASLLLANLALYKVRNQPEAVLEFMNCCDIYGQVFVRVAECYVQLQPHATQLLADLQQLGANIVAVHAVLAPQQLKGMQHTMDQFHGLLAAVTALIDQDKTLQAEVAKCPSNLAAFKAGPQAGEGVGLADAAAVLPSQTFIVPKTPKS